MGHEAFFDTSVFLYATARTDKRGPIASSVLEAGGVTSIQVIIDFTAIARSRLGRSWPEVHEALSIFSILCPNPVPVRLATYECALELVQQECMALPDALVAAAALETGCSRLVTEMAHDGRVVGERLTICNPFGQQRIMAGGSIRTMR